MRLKDVSLGRQAGVHLIASVLKQLEGDSSQGHKGAHVSISILSQMSLGPELPHWVCNRIPAVAKRNGCKHFVHRGRAEAQDVAKGMQEAPQHQHLWSHLIAQLSRESWLQPDCRRREGRTLWCRRTHCSLPQHAAYFTQLPQKHADETNSLNGTALAISLVQGRLLPSHHLKIPYRYKKDSRHNRQISDILLKVK